MAMTRTHQPPIRRSAPPGTLGRRDFFAAVVERLRVTLPAELADFRHAANLSLLKVYYGNERVHFEVWASSEHHSIEIGLHFEDGPLSTAAFLTYFDGLIVELKHTLGPEMELERWTPSWGHLYEHWPLDPLTNALAGRVAQRLVRLITTLQPLVDAAAVAPERTAQHSDEQRGAWRHWRRGRE